VDDVSLLKALADDTRMDIISLLLRHRYCVGALARELGLSEAAVSQHLKILKETGLIKGERHGYFMHYDVERETLEELSIHIGKLAAIKRKPCNYGDDHGKERL
jgi:ArsR family transcriptional regulator